MIRIPKERIALYPSKPRDACKLLVLYRDTGKIFHSKFYKIHHFLEEGDIIIVNDTKVIPAKLYGRKETGGNVEVLFVKKIGERVFEGFLKGKNVKEFYINGEKIKIIGKTRFFYVFEIENMSVDRILKIYGKMPLPPYIRRKPEYRDRFYYNSIFAKKEGSIASPTASLHFTDRVLKKLNKKGIKVLTLTLEVGPFTFMFVEDEEISKEYYEIPKKTVEGIKRCKEHGKRVVACGTTVVRALETWIRNKKRIGYTDLIIKPPFEFRVVDAFITNFHLPDATPILLTSSFLGNKEFLKKSYKEALNRGYRFFSYGDAMLIL